MEESEVEQILKKLFTSIGDEYKNALKKIEDDSSWVSFCVEDLDPADYAAVKKYFLENYDDKSDLHFDKLGFPDDWHKSDIFDRCFENLLEWVGMDIALQAKKPEFLVQEFKRRLKTPPLTVVLAPLFRLSNAASYYMDDSIQLGGGACLYQPNWVEREFLKRQFVSLRNAKGYPPGFHNAIPSFVIKSSAKVTADRSDVAKTGNRIIEQFKVLMTGLFGVSLETPFYFRGIQSAWHCWDCSSGNHSAFDPSGGRRDFIQVDRDHIEAIKHHWADIGARHLQHFGVTSARLNFAEKRENGLDKIVDYAVAIEGLFQTSEPTVKMCSALGYLLSDDPDERIKIYETFREFFRVRGEIVHGEALENSTKDAALKYKAMDRNQFKNHMETISESIRTALRVLLLNPDLYNSRTLAHLLLGEKRELVRGVFQYRKAGTTSDK